MHLRVVVGARLVAAVLFGLLLASALGATIVRSTGEFNIVGTVDCGRPSGRSCQIGNELSLYSEDISGRLERVTVDVSWIRSKLPDLDQDDLIRLEVANTADGGIRALRTIDADGVPPRKPRKERDEVVEPPTATPTSTATIPPRPAAATPSATPTSSPTATLVATGTASPTSPTTPTRTATASATSTPTVTATPTPTLTPTVTPTRTITPTPTATQPAPSRAMVNIANFVYLPDPVVIAVGGTVTWKNLDFDQHTVTDEGVAWTSPFLNQGDTFSRTFSQKGTFVYFCEPHPFMVAQIEVQ